MTPSPRARSSWTCPTASAPTGRSPSRGLAPGATERVDVEVTNDDDSLPTANQGGVNGDYDYTVLTTSGAGTSESAAALELVPTATVGDTAAPGSTAWSRTASTPPRST